MDSQRTDPDTYHALSTYRGTMGQDTDTGQRGSVEALQPFTGRMLLGICFESGHSIWLYDFDSTPTDLGAYREFWVVEPDDTRTLYFATEGVDDEMAPYHEWDQSVAAEMEWEWTTDHVDVRVSEPEGVTIEIDGTVDDSPRSRVLTLLQRSLPGPLHERLFQRRTETGAVGHLKTPEVLVLTRVTGRIDGRSLGAVQAPETAVTFGEVSAFDRPYVFVGDLMLEYPVD